MVSTRDHFLPPTVTFSLVAIAVIAMWTWNVGASDMDHYFIPWFDHLRSAGPIGAFAAPFGNYTPLSLYPLAIGSLFGGLLAAWSAIKIVFLTGHLLLVLAVARLLRAAAVDHPLRWAYFIGLAPSLLANPAMIAQCDAFWAAALVMALTAAVERRHVAMFLWCGLAVAMKLQAVFLAPFFLTLALSRCVPLQQWLIAPLSYMATMVPVALLGWPVIDLATIYFRQMGWSEALALNAPNIWMLAMTAHITVPSLIPTLLAVGASLGFVVLFTPRLKSSDAVDLIRTACLCAMVVPGLLPRMHERYFFMADVLTLVLAAARPREWRPALCAQIGSSLGILAYFTNVAAFACVGAVAMIYGTLLIARSLWTAAPATAPASAMPA